MSQPKPQQVAKDLWQTTRDALLSLDEVDAVYTRLGFLEVALDDDPLAYGPKRLQEKTAMCRKHLAECERIFLDVSHRQHRLKRALRAQKSALELSTKFLYAEDPEVRAGRNIADRDAFAAIKLKDEWLAVHSLELQTQDMEAVLFVIKAKRSDLRDTQGRLRDQARLCGQELELGGRWGTKRPNAPELQPRHFAHGGDVEEVLQLIDEVGAASEIDLDVLSEEEDEGENEGSEPIPFVNPDDNLDLSALDDEGDGASEPIRLHGTGETFETLANPVSEVHEMVLDPGDPQTAAEALPGNGVKGDEIDRMLNAVSLPASTVVTGRPPMEDFQIANLLDMFE